MTRTGSTRKCGSTRWNIGRSSILTGWTIPFHVHTNSFQVLDNSGVPERAWRDTFLVRAGRRVRLRLQFNDYTGTTVYHCHILDHSDLGMMATLQIV